jgi:hypothetical protein
MAVDKSGVSPSSDNVDLDKEVSLSQSIVEARRLIFTNSFGPVALASFLFAYVCVPTSVFHAILLVIALLLLLLVRSVARREGFQLAKRKAALLAQKN